MKGTGLVSLETAKSQCEFFTLNSHRPSNDNDVRFIRLKTSQKNRVLQLCLLGLAYEYALNDSDIKVERIHIIPI